MEYQGSWTRVTASGLPNDETAAPGAVDDGDRPASTAPTATVAGSAYPIVPSAAIGTGLDYYSVSYANGSLTVVPSAYSLQGSVLALRCKIRGRVHPGPIILRSTRLLEQSLQTPRLHGQ